MKKKLTLFVWCFIMMSFYQTRAQQIKIKGDINEPATVTIGDNHLRFVVSLDSKFTESNFQSNQQNLLGLVAIPWMVKVDGKTLTPNHYESKSIGIPLNNLVRHAEFTGELEEFSWKLSYDVRGLGRITKTLTLTCKRDLQLELITLWDAHLNSNPVVSRTRLQDIACFYRNNSSGMFVSLDFPYSKIAIKNGLTQVFYPPYVKLKKGSTYTAHTLTLGATKLTGRERFGFYEGEVAEMDNYIQERFKPRFDRPMFLTSSINNRYTQPKGDIIFYTNKDQPTLNYNTDLLKRELALMPKLGMEYYQVFPGVFDWAPGDPNPDTVKMLMDYARSHGLRMGNYSGTSLVFCPHYNNHRNHLNKPEWLIKSKDGKHNSGYCFGDSNFVNFYLKAVVQNAKQYGFEIHCLDFLNIQPCYDTTHGHPAGEYSVYQQIIGLVKVLQGINSVSPQMMTWSNSGNWDEFLPKIAWVNPNLYLTDPYISLPFQGLNMTRLLDDARREQMVSLHYSRFIPYRFMSNFQYFFSQNSIVPDLRNYQFGVLSSLAVTPNLGLGEIRPWIDRQSPEDQKNIIAFYKKWTTFIQKNFELWKQTFHVGDDPGVGSVEIYSHAQEDHGFIFIVNSSYSNRTVNVPIDDKLGFSGKKLSLIRELYPIERKRLTALGPFFNLGSELPIYVPARQVLVLEVLPAPVKIIEPTLFGLPGSIIKTSKGYLLKTVGMQGANGRIAVLLPEGSDPITFAKVRMDVPKQMERQVYSTPLKLVGSESRKNYWGLNMDIQFRREAVPTELRYWMVRPGSLQIGLNAGFDSGFSASDSKISGTLFPMLTNVDNFHQLAPTDKMLDSLKLGRLANFLGGYIENAFGEMQETWIQLYTKEVPNKIPTHILSSDEVAEAPRKLDSLAHAEGDSWWFQTEFDLPFMYTIGAEPFFDQHTFLVLPFLRQNQIKQIHAWVNGKPLGIQAYHYPRNRSLATFYADLVGTGVHGGKNRIVVHVQFN